MSFFSISNAKRWICLLLLTTSINCIVSGAPRKTLPLDGRWRFAMDQDNRGIDDNWYVNHVYTQTIALPGTTDEAGYGPEAPKPSMVVQSTFGWRRPAFYEGAAWYERDVMIPDSWNGKIIELFLEQTRCRTTVWVDGKLASGKEASVATSHIHDLTACLTPGLHKITMLLDNKINYYIGGSYIRSTMGQGNWHGVVGKIELRACDPVNISHVRFDSKDCKIGEVKVKINNMTGEERAVSGKVCFVEEGKILESVPFQTIVSGKEREVEVNIDLSKLQLWSQFNPKLYDLQVEIQSEGFSDEYVETTGVRRVDRNENHYITINGVPTFMRGAVDYNIFPMTGYPSTNVADWLRVMKIYKDWGMNHIRFHSLTPPEAAFIAADQLGMYLHCECPRTGIIHDLESENSFHVSEGLKIIHDYGNHPSFVMMSMGNELAGSRPILAEILKKISADDQRRIYTASTGGADKANLKDDYKVCGTRIRGFKGPQTDWDYHVVVDTMNTTLISHEVGQWFIYPDLSLIPKYNGVMRADNLKMIRDDLQRRGMLEMAPEFSQITGAFSALLYKEEFEAIQRTPGLSGFQMHNLHDFPSQGTATCGMLDLFDDEKGFITAEQFREYVAPVVPLARMSKRVFTSDEFFEARIDLSNFTEGPVGNGVLDWRVEGDGQVFYNGKLTKKNFPSGNVYKVGEIKIDLSDIKSPRKLQLIVEVEGTEYRNRWNFWVYPDGKKKDLPENVKVTETWKETRKALEKGETVFFFPSTSEIAQWRPGQFKDVFWCPVWLKRGPETMSVWAHPEHPALSGFPTDRNTDWQWFGPLEHSFVMSIEKLPIDFKPIVGVIDSFRKNQRLADIFEAKVGKGKLMVSTIDLQNDLENDLARTNLRNSLFEYVGSDRFEPEQELTVGQLDVLFQKIVRSQSKAFPEMKNAVYRQKAGSDPSICKSGYSMKVLSKIAKAGEITAWADKRDILLNLTCPQSEDGTIYLFMRNSLSDRFGNLKTPQEAAAMDWIEETMVQYGNQENRPVSAFLIGHEFADYIETISDFGYDGKWFALPVKSSQMDEGRLDLMISTLNLPNVLLEIAFVPNK